MAPPLPWKASNQPDPERDYLALATHLPLQRYLETPSFFRFVRQVRSQLRESKGLIGYSLLAKPLRKDYWTLSVWDDESALQAFVGTNPHLDVMSKLHTATSSPPECRHSRHVTPQRSPRRSSWVIVQQLGAVRRNNRGCIGRPAAVSAAPTDRGMRVAYCRV